MWWGEDSGKWSVGICPMTDLGEGRAVHITDPSSWLCQDPDLGPRCGKSNQVLPKGHVVEDHRAGKPKEVTEKKC